MAKIDKATLKSEGEALKTVIAQARKKQLNFALLQGKDQMYLETHLKKNPEMLRKEAKKNGGGPKAVMGTLHVEGKVLIFSVAEEPPGTFAKLTKKFLMLRGLPMIVVFRLPDGSEFGDEEAEEGAAPAPEAKAGRAPEGEEAGGVAAEEEAPNPMLAALEKAYKKLEPELVKQVKQLERTAQKTVVELQKQFKEALEGENVKNATGFLKNLAQVAKAAKDAAEKKLAGGDTDGAPAEGASPAVDAPEEPASVEKMLADATIPDDQKADLAELAKEHPELAEAALEAIKGIDAAVAPINATEQGLTDAQAAEDAAKAAMDKQNETLIRYEKGLEIAETAVDKATSLFESAQSAATGAAKRLTDAEAIWAGMSSEAKAALSLAQRAKIEANLLKLQALKKAAELALDAARFAKEKAEQAYKAIDEKTDAESEKYFALQSDHEDAKEHKGRTESAIDAKENMTQSLKGGLLSPDAPNPMSEDDISKVLGAYGADPMLGEATLGLVGKTDDRDALLANTESLTQNVKDGFPDKDGNQFEGDPGKYAADALKMGEAMGGTYFEDMDAFVANGGMNKPNPLEAAGTDNGAQSRANYVGDAMLGDGGKIDTTSDKAKDALGVMNFHPDMLDDSMAGMNMHFAEMSESMADPANADKCQAALDGVSLDPIEVPPGLDIPIIGDALRQAAADNDTGRNLVSRNDGTNPLDVTEGDVKGSIMSAMFTPLDQGEVGSCFATGPARKERQSDPARVMEDMAQIATKGTFTPAAQPPATTGDEMRAVGTAKIPPGENQLMRSWEYSIATAGAQLAGSYEQENLFGQLFGADTGGDDLDGLQGVLPAGADWTTIQSSLEAAVRSDLTFRYNAVTTSSGGPSADGSSTGGNFEIYDKVSSKIIVTKEDFIASITRIALASAGEAEGTETGDKIIAYCKADKFIDAICPDDVKPWEIAEGGFAKPMMQALNGGSPETKDLLGDAPAGQDIGDRTKDVTSALLKEFASTSDSDDLVSITTGGMHAFNGLPNDPSLAKILADKDPAKIDAAIEELLLKPGKKISETKMDKEQAITLFNKQMDAASDTFLYQEGADGSYSIDETAKALLETAMAKGPTEDMNPKDVHALVELVLTPLEDHANQRDMAAWEASMTTPATATEPEVKPTATEIADKLKEIQLAAENAIDGSFASDAATMCGAPQIVVADTNWGDAGSHTYFVVIPDPASGELRMFSKEEPSGTLTALTDDWLTTNWQATK